MASYMLSALMLLQFSHFVFVAVFAWMMTLLVEEVRPHSRHYTRAHAAFSDSASNTHDDRRLVVFALEQVSAPMMMPCFYLCAVALSPLVSSLHYAVLHVRGADVVLCRWDTIMYTLYFVAVLMRLSTEYETLQRSRYMYSVVALLMWMRLARQYAVSMDLGPKLVMVQLMVVCYSSL